MQTFYGKARQLVEQCVIKNQTSVVEIMWQAGLLEDEICCIADDIMEWWLVDSWLAEQLLQRKETIVSAYGSIWWGRRSSGQAVWLDCIIREIADS